MQTFAMKTKFYLILLVRILDVITTGVLVHFVLVPIHLKTNKCKCYLFKINDEVRIENILECSFVCFYSYFLENNQVFFGALY